jgi:hypothetical protein
MNLNVVQRLIDMLPEGAKKQELLVKLNQATKRSSQDGGLSDTFEFAPKGHILIEKIDSTGNVLGVLADQPNLVVNGAEEILLRSFSGDPDRILYKVRVPKTKDASGNLVSSKYHIALSNNISSVINGVDQLNFPPNAFWKAVDDKEFDIFYSYRPHTVFLKEDTSDQVGKKAFRICANIGTGCIPLAAEIYSTSTNMFIGLGDGKNLTVPFTDSRLTVAAGFVDDAGKRTAVTTESDISFKEKISNFVVGYEKSNAGGQIEVYINNVLNTTIETLDSALAAPVAASKEFNGLNLEAETEVKIVFSGADSSVSLPQVTVTSIQFDALSKDMTGMIHEFENFTKAFDTVSIYNTTTSSPFVTQLNQFPVANGSVVVEYDNVKLAEVDSLDKLAEGTFFVDAKYGKVYFHRALTGLLITYHITGEQYTLKLPSSLTAGSLANSLIVPLDHPVKTAKVFGYSSQTEFTLVTDEASFGDGKFMLDATKPNQLIVSKNKADGTAVNGIEVVYVSDEAPGFATGYGRSIIEKPKTGVVYPWYQLDKGTVSFVAEFPENVPAFDVTIREMGLFDGPRADDKIEGFSNYPVHAFSLVRVGESRKEVNTGIRVTWTITLLNKDGQPFVGGF